MRLSFRAAQSKEAGIRTLVALDDQGGESIPILRRPFSFFFLFFFLSPLDFVCFRKRPSIVSLPLCPLEIRLDCCNVVDTFFKESG